LLDSQQGQGRKARSDRRGGPDRTGRDHGARLLRAQGRRDPGGPEPGPRTHRGLPLVRHPREAAPVALEADLRVGRQLGARDPDRDAPDPHPALPADAQELFLDEEDAEARAEDERDPGQVQEGQERRGPAAEDERGADEALPGGGVQPDERVLPDPPAASDPRRLLQRAVARDRAAPRAVHPLDSRSVGGGPHVRAPHPDDRDHVHPAGDDADDRRPGAEEDLHGDAADLGVLPEGHALRPRPVLALLQRPDDPPAGPHPEDGQRRAGRREAGQTEASARRERLREETGRIEAMRYEGKTENDAVEAAAQALGVPAGELKYKVVRDEKSFWGGRVVEIELEAPGRATEMGIAPRSEERRVGR